MVGMGIGIPDQWQAGFPLLVGALLLVACGFGISRTRRFLEGAESAEAHVVDMEKRRRRPLGGGIPTTVYHPVVSFTTLDGEEVTATAPISYPTRRMLGAVVGVVYDPSQPDHARIDTTKGRGWLGLGLIGIFGAFLVLFGVRNLMP